LGSSRQWWRTRWLATRWSVRSAHAAVSDAAGKAVATGVVPAEKSTTGARHCGGGAHLGARSMGSSGGADERRQPRWLGDLPVGNEWSHLWREIARQPATGLQSLQPQYARRRERTHVGAHRFRASRPRRRSTLSPSSYAVCELQQVNIADQQGESCPLKKQSTAGNVVIRNAQALRPASIARYRADKSSLLIRSNTSASAAPSLFGLCSNVRARSSSSRSISGPSQSSGSRGGGPDKGSDLTSSAQSSRPTASGSRLPAAYDLATTRSRLPPSLIRPNRGWLRCGRPTRGRHD
jgi:hypothetical protein